MIIMGTATSTSVTETPSISSGRGARWQQLAGLGPDNVHEVQPNGGRRTRYARNFGIAIIYHLTIFRLDDGFDAAVGIVVVDHHRGLALLAATMPRSMAKGPTPERMLPHEGAVSTRALSMETWANR